MSATVKEARLRLTLIDGVSLNAALISKSLNRLNRNVNAITRMATFAAGYVGVTQAIEGTVGAARKFEAQIREIAIKGDLSESAAVLERLAELLKCSCPIPTVATVLAGYIQSNISFKLHIDASRFQTSICAILANVLRFGFPRSPPINLGMDASIASNAFHR